MKLYAIALIGTLAALPMACHIDVDDYCGDDDDWDDDDEHCETHVHSDTSDGSGSGTDGASVTATTSGTTGAGGGGSGGSDGASGSTGGSSASGDAGGTHGDGSSAGGSDGANGSSTDTGSSAGEAGSGNNGTCEDCSPLPDGTSCLWGSAAMDSCCSVDVLVDVAARECVDFGLELADFTLEQACAGGHEQISYQCCRVDVSGCSDEQVSLEACVSESVLAMLAEQVCSDAGQALGAMSAGDACGDDTFQSVDVTCCVMD